MIEYQTFRRMSRRISETGQPRQAVPVKRIAFCRLPDRELQSRFLYLTNMRIGCSFNLLPRGRNVGHALNQCANWLWDYPAKEFLQTRSDTQNIFRRNSVPRAQGQGFAPNQYANWLWAQPTSAHREGDGDELGKVALDLLRILQRMVGEVGGGGSGSFPLPVVGPQSNRLIQHNLDGVRNGG